MTPLNPLLAYQARQKQRTITAIDEAKREIEAEIQKNGFYPQNGGRLSKREVLRRASVSPQTLKNANHKETTQALDRWLSRLKKTPPTLKADAENVRANKLTTIEKRLAEVVGHYDRFKIEYNDLLCRCEELEIENAALRKQLAESGKVVSIKASQQ